MGQLCFKAGGRPVAFCYKAAVSPPRAAICKLAHWQSYHAPDICATRHWLQV